MNEDSLNARNIMNFRPLSVGCTLALLTLHPFLAGSLRGAQGEVVSTSPSLVAETERAVVRSQEDQTKALSLMKEAQSQRAERNFEAAYKTASKALQIAPTGGPARHSIVSDYTGIALGQAQQLIQGGSYLEAETVLKSILDPSVNPGNKEAVTLLSHLEQPEYYNKTVTPKSAALRDQVIKLLREAQGLEQSGRHELAMKQYDAVLRIDPYNTAARKGMEAVDNAKLQYANEAYNETRSRMLWQVEKAWERPPRKAQQGRSTESVGRQQDARGTDQIVAKLNSIIIPKIDLNDVPISEAVEYLKQKSVDQDSSRKGVNIFLKLSGPAAPSIPGAPSIVTEEPRVTLSLTQVPLYVALDYLSKLSNLKLKIDPYAVSIVPLSEPTDVLITKEYQVPPTFIPVKQVDTNATALPQAGAGFGPEGASDNPRVAARYNAQEYLTSQGVAFPSGASANYLPAGSKLVVRNTRDNIDQIDALVDAAMGVAPSQVEIQTKFLEINQNNLQELGFDWLLGPLSIGGGVYGSGGGNPTGIGSGVYPFNFAGTPIGQFPVGSLRSGTEAVTPSSIGGLLDAVNADAFQSAQASGRTINTPAPGIFSIAGIFSDPQFQLVIRALNQKKGIDLMSAPKVTTKSGVKAVVKIIQEFIYPRQYDPPQIPQQVTNNGVPPTITPSFPRDWTKAEVGVVLEAKPTIGPDGYTMNLELHPKVTDFDGFINYGSVISEVGYPQAFTGVDINIRQEPQPQAVTTNPIKQPVFSYRSVDTFVTVWDGQTVALGGLIREDVQKVQDKVPFLGDIPLAGRLFRSEVDQKLKKNLIIFVTPRILDANGEPRRGDSDEQEVVTPLGLPQDIPQPTFSTKAVRTK